MVGRTCYSFQNSLLWPWLFFVTPLIFGNGSKISAVCQLWTAITPVQKLVGPKTSTFSESSGCELSHGSTLNMCFYIKISSNLAKSKKNRFLHFFVSLSKIFQVAAHRTLSKIGALPIAHFEDNVPIFSKHMLKLAIPSNIGLRPRQSQLIRICVPEKKLLFDHFFGKS